MQEFTDESTERTDSYLFGKNVTYLTILQVFNYVLPLVTLPYLVRVLGAEGFGYVSFAVSFAAYFLFVTEYGFNTVATKEISVNRNNETLSSSIFVSVILIKLSLLILSLPLFLIIASFLEQGNFSPAVYYICFLTVIGYSLFPAWYFKGREEMKYIAILNFITRSIAVIMIFALVKNADDYIVYAVIINSGFLLLGISGFLLSVIKYGIKLKFPRTEMLKKMLREGFYMFLSNVCIGIYNNSNSFLLGLFTNLSAVGYYSAAYRIVNAASSFVYVISESMFPRITYVFSRDKKSAVQKLKKYFYLSTVTGFLISAGLFIFADTIVTIVLGTGFESSVPVLRILSFIPVTVSAGVIFGVQGIAGMGHYKTFLKIMLAGVIFYLASALIMVQGYAETGASISLLATEVIVALIAYFAFRKQILSI